MARATLDGTITVDPTARRLAALNAAVAYYGSTATEESILEAANRFAAWLAAGDPTPSPSPAEVRESMPDSLVRKLLRESRDEADALRHAYAAGWAEADRTRRLTEDG